MAGKNWRINRKIKKPVEVPFLVQIYPCRPKRPHKLRWNSPFNSHKMFGNNIVLMLHFLLNFSMQVLLFCIYISRHCSFTYCIFFCSYLVLAFISYFFLFQYTGVTSFFPPPLSLFWVITVVSGLEPGTSKAQWLDENYRGWFFGPYIHSLVHDQNNAVFKP